MTGAFLRVKRDDGWTAVEVEHLTGEERKECLGNRTPEELLRWLDVVCEKLSETEKFLDELEAGGLIAKK